MLADFNWSLPCTWSVNRKKSNTERKDRCKTFRQIFLPAVEPVDRDDQRNGAGGVLRQPKVAHDFLPLEGNVNYLQGRVQKFRVRLKGLERFRVRLLFAGRYGDGPATERVNPPCTNVIRIRFGRIGRLQRSGLVGIAVTHTHESSGPFIWIAGLDRGEGLLYVAGIEADHGIHSILGTMNGFSLDLVKGAFRSLLCGRY